ncbi:MAG: glycosyl transferase family 1 [Flavobacteriales bacterium]
MKKVLIITYNWPPGGGIVVLRCLKFVKYLRNFDWEPLVYTVSNPTYPYLDYSNEKDIPEGITIIKQPIMEPIGIFKKLSGRKKSEPLLNIIQSSSKKRSFADTLGIWVRGNFFIPDARALWIKPSVKHLEEYLKDNPVNAILTDGPPHTNTVIGQKLAQKLNLPWLADFQDPWTQVDYYEKLLIGKRADRKHKKLEQETFKTANKITIASPTWKKDLESIGAKNVDVVYYGYDEDDFRNFEKRPTSLFKLFHAGLLGNDRNPTVLFECLSELISEKPELKQFVRIVLAGETDYEVFETIKQHHLDDVTENLGIINRKEVFKHYSDSSLLLLPINKSKNAKGRIPGKLYEYMRTYTPILAFGPKDGDVKNIIESKLLGKSFEYDEKTPLKNYLKEELESFLKNGYKQLSSDISEFSNENQTKKIASYLNEISQLTA